MTEDNPTLVVHHQQSLKHALQELPARAPDQGHQLVFEFEGEGGLDAVNQLPDLKSRPYRVGRGERS